MTSSILLLRLACTACGLHYPVRDGIPIMLPEEAYRPEPGKE